MIKDTLCSYWCHCALAGSNLSCYMSKSCPLPVILSCICLKHPQTKYKVLFSSSNLDCSVLSSLFIDISKSQMVNSEVFPLVRKVHIKNALKNSIDLLSDIKAGCLQLSIPVILNRIMTSLMSNG